MRPYYLLAALPLLACQPIPDSDSVQLKKDLEQASRSTEEVSLPKSPGTQIVSALERLDGPSQTQPSRRSPRHIPAPLARHSLARSTASPTPSIPPEVLAAAPDPIPDPAAWPDPAPLPSPRPSPVYVPGEGSTRTRGGSIGGIGSVIGTVIGVVIRGATVGDGDQCDPRTEGSHRPAPRLPVPSGTFPRRY